MKRPRKTTTDQVLRAIILVRAQKVILDVELASLYSVETRAVIQAVKRNRSRFPNDFLFQLTQRELSNLKSQNVISSSWGGRRTRPYAFTEHGVAMLSSVLRSPRAVKVNIEIMRAFVKLRRVLDEHRDLARRLDALEQRYDSNFQVVFDAIRKLIAEPARPQRRIGYLRSAANDGNFVAQSPS